jgi:NitT/TauT family transport system substrate-binding protein
MLRLKVLLLAVVLVLAHASALSAQERARIGWAAMTASHVPLWVAQEKGLLVKHGLTPELIFFSAGTTALQALVAGDLDVVLTSAPNVVNPRFGGADTIMIMSIIPTIIDHIIAAPNITSPEQLKGKIGGVNRQGTVSEMGLRLALRRLGVDPEKDTKIVTAGGNPERLAAISKGIVHFTIMNEPFLKEAERLGLRDLVNIATLKIPLQWNGVVTREATVKARRPMLTRLVRALTEAIHYIKVEKEGTKAVIGKYARLTDPDGLERTYKKYASVLPETPYPDPAGIKTLFGRHGAAQSQSRSGGPENIRRSEFRSGNGSVGVYQATL